MERGRYVLAIDHGTSGIKASIVSTRGEVMDSDFHPTPIRFLEGGGAEQDPEAWWQGVLATARRLTSRKSVMPEDIAAFASSPTARICSPNDVRYRTVWTMGNRAHEM